MKSDARHTNRLANATSPYLLQHAHNPVDWYPWGPEALARAAAEDRPILLSIGYAACHWCHVMAHESFEDEGTASLMNEHFVSVKVDREERPDLDAIYMDAVQAMTGQGGWPMTVFLTPQGEPFYAGTYFPPEDRHGLPGFRRLLHALAEVWRDRRDDALEQGRRVAQALAAGAAAAASDEPLAEELLRTAHASFASSFDPRWGGFGQAPKFPQPMSLELLLRCHLRGYPGSLEMVTTTLDRMADGGIHDHVGGGFHRYSVDGRWHVPHFEKMLYDNALLARTYLHAWQVTGRERYRTVVLSTLDYLLREMRHPDGGFFSSQDADSEGVEGRFYAWPWDELVSAAGEEAARAYGASPEGNWEGTNVLWLPRRAADAPERAPDPAALEAARARLFDRREGRVRPATDDKVLAAWNGLAIAAFAEAGRVLGRPDYVDAAREAARFVRTRLVDGSGLLHRSWRGGRTSGPAYLDDHALLVDGLLALYQSTFETQTFVWARSLATDMARRFHDAERGGFFQTASSAEPLLVRPKELFDNAVPSGNSAAADVLLRLALLTGDADLERLGASALRAGRDLMARAPSAFGHALCALDLYLSPSREVAVVGPSGPEREALVAEVWRRFLPNAVLAVADPGDDDAADAVPLLADRTPADGRAAAFVCERFVCRRPVHEPTELAALLDA
jgi:uncharacterized protein YyaL (SSP411 family)